jgi:hypothetical protein
MENARVAVAWGGLISDLAVDRLKMTGKFSAEDEQLLREALGDSYADLIPPNRVGYLALMDTQLHAR